MILNLGKCKSLFKAVWHPDPLQVTECCHGRMSRQDKTILANMWKMLVHSCGDQFIQHDVQCHIKDDFQNDKHDDSRVQHQVWLTVGARGPFSRKKP